MGYTDWQFIRVYSRLLWSPIMIVSGFLRFISSLVIFTLVMAGVDISSETSDWITEIIYTITFRDRIVSSYVIF